MTAARQQEADLKAAEVAGKWYEKLQKGECAWATLPPPIKAIFMNKNPLVQEAGAEGDVE